MITRIELSGFKTFDGFVLDLAPFQVIVGPNSAGKSNLFDALRLLSLLATEDLRSAFQALRGEAGELFTALPDGRTIDHITLAVEMLVERQVRDSWGAQAELKHPRLRYEVSIARRTDDQGLERLYVTHESLAPIRREDDYWARNQFGKSQALWLPALKRGRAEAFISTVKTGDAATIYLHQDGHGGRKASAAERVERTVLSGVTNTEFPHAFAVREEMRTWGFLQLNPEVLRQPSSLLAQPYLSTDGSNLPSALARMQIEDPLSINDVSRELANLVPGILGVEVEKDQPRNRYIVWARMQDGRVFSSRVLSDGTLRLLALVTLKNDAQHRGVLCFEEPENGVHPFRLKNMVELLQGLATDFSDNEQASLPLRQLLVNTHSPVLAGQPQVIPHLLLAYMTSRVRPGSPSSIVRVTRVAPVLPSPQMRLTMEIGEQEGSYTLGEVLDYLNTAESAEAQGVLRREQA